jgi:tRNA(Ile)-lysidine synthase
MWRTMLSEFEQKLARYIEAKKLFEPPSRVLLAVSGGADSTALVYSLTALKEQKILSADFVCVHINHQLRGADSLNDEKFVIGLANRFHLPLVTKKVDVRSFARSEKLSIETAARQLRISTLIEIAKSNNCLTIASAHHADDNAETVIHRLLRGTGLRGLAGIKPKNVFNGNITFVRPLLDFTRTQITGYLEERGLNWQTDATNFDCRYKRNFIRHRLLPELQVQCSTSLVEQLSKLSQASQKFQDSAGSITQKLWPKIASCQKNSVVLNLSLFSNLHPAVKTELIHKTLVMLNCPERNLTQQHYEKILQLSQYAGSNKKIALPALFSVRKEYTSLVFEKPPPQPDATYRSAEKIEITIPAKIQTDNFLIEANLLDADPQQMKNFKKTKTAYIEWFDFDKITLPVTLRKKVAGDRFYPLGQHAEKKIGKFLTDQKIPSSVRSKILIVSDNQKILWVWPVRISEPAKVSAQTKKILQLQIRDLHSSHPA